MTSIDTIVRAGAQPRRFGRWTSAAALLALAGACSSSSSSDGGAGSTTKLVDSGTCPYTQLSQAATPATCTPAGGVVQGTPDSHCGTGASAKVQATGMCVGVPDVDAAAPAAGDDSADNTATGDDAAGDAAGGDAAAGADAGNDGTCGETDYAPTNYGAKASDDDCKYDVSWTSTPVCKNGNVYFTVKVTKRAGADGQPALSDEPPLTGASVSAEVVYNDCATIAPNSHQTTVDQGGGVYKVGPIVFDVSGNWNVRFHFNECCSDDPADSPHGHAAFWVNVP
jgi:hypothetical protein